MMSARQFVRAALLLILSCVAAPVLVSAQEQAPQSLVLTVDMTRLFNESSLAERLRREVEGRLSELSSENRRIEAELEAEELALTEQRKTLPAEEFKLLADAFDEKVRMLRSEQDAKGRALQQVQDEERAKLLQQISPVLAAIARESGAIVVLDRRSVVISIDAIDVTDLAIQRINAATQTDGTVQE